MAKLNINKNRLWENILTLSRMGAVPGGGISRLALSDEDKLGRDLLCSWLTDLGIRVQIDKVGNIIAIRQGKDETLPVIIGSHLDTVSNGGKFDGAAGVLAGLEILQVMEEENFVTNAPIGLVAFTNEEGVRFHTDMLGSRAFCGELTPDEVWRIRGVDGLLVGEELKRIGYLGDFPCGSIRPRAYLELHVEQGPDLDRAQIPIGVVEAITGIAWLEIIVSGVSNHAGTTPMDQRKDAGIAASKMITFLPELAKKIPNQTATCGRFSLSPGMINVIPGEARFNVDLRNIDSSRLLEAENNFIAHSRQVAQQEEVTIATEVIMKVPPEKCDKSLVSLIESISKTLDYHSQRMVSRAGHDAQILCNFCPSAMIFIPSQNGVSHSPNEYSSPADIEAGANVLLHTVLQLAA